MGAKDTKDNRRDQIAKMGSFAIFDLKVVIFHLFRVRAVLREDVKIRHSSRFSSIIPSRRLGFIIPLCFMTRSQI